MIGRYYFVVMLGNTLSMLGCNSISLMNLSISTLYRWSVTQISSTISSPPFPLLLLLCTRDLRLKIKVDEAFTVWVPAVTFVTNLPAPFDNKAIIPCIFAFE